jgi:predicted metalloprotease with PDZ domain
MERRLIIIFFLVCNGLRGHAREVHYAFSPVWNRTGNLIALQIRLETTGDADGATEIQLPSRFGAAQYLYRGISRLRCVSGHPVVQSPDSLVWVVQHPPGAALVMTYEVQQDWRGEYPDLRTIYHPRIGSDYFYVLGAAVFAVPRSTDGYSLVFEYDGFPPDWHMHCSLGLLNDKKLSFSSPDARWLETLFTGGLGWRTYTVFIQERPVSLVLRGHQWVFSDSLVVQTLRDIVTCQRAYWNDFDVPYYTVTLIPMAEEAGYLTYVGTGLVNAFVTFAAPVDGFTLDELSRLFYHELMHHWIGNEIRNGGAPDDMQFAWWSEGFTEYCALMAPLQCGIVDSAYFIEVVNERFFAGLWTSEGRTLPNSVIAERFFTDATVHEIPYLRGFLFAWHLDRLIEKKSNKKRSLQWVMRDLLAWYRLPERSISTHFDELMRVLSKETGQNARHLYERYILRGELIPAQILTAPAGFELKVGPEGIPILRKK